MAAIRVNKPISLTRLSQERSPFSVFFDCWKASCMFFVSDTRQWAVNGVDIGAFSVNVAAAIPFTSGVPFTLGGMMRKGEPVNLCTQWDFTPLIAVNTLCGFIIMEYFDEALRDPQR